MPRRDPALERKRLAASLRAQYALVAKFERLNFEAEVLNPWLAHFDAELARGNLIAVDDVKLEPPPKTKTTGRKAKTKRRTK
jgi:hypothetical protein